ncbi:TonB-dependent receptor [Mucilaginibacter flavidus]|uniref:TonB-dependent receptor n=1 Tax=Mucilaginibacter flavidus TaxID=2949309 RepID=UPI0020938726|nr:TonB-dependent receptor [Mucilaginibacter flavidus]MCO5950642.1 TonB-dependent receptor [Mucilaginibacter flavidus]
MKQKLIIACLMLCFCRVHGQNAGTFGNPVISKLKTFLATHLTEKVYLQFDKPYYATGDTVYFKAYVTFGERHQLSTLSGVLHVDLINTNNKIDQSIKLQLVNGLAWGDFLLPDSLPKGNYRIRAYTQWMRNEADASFFEQVVSVGSTEKEKIAESTPAGAKINSKPDVQFFPESGNLGNGLKSKIAFKAVGANGKGIDVAGVVLDNNNTEICRFASTHLGMGYFYLQPQEGKSYAARITYADGMQSVAKLPDAGTSGLVLTVNNDSLPKASVRIEANKVCFAQNRDKDYTLLIYSGGVATSVICKLDSSVILLDIAKRHLHTGVATVTLFSPAGEPLCERLFFVQNYDQLKLDIKSDKTVYAAREKVNISLLAKNRADSASMGHFSVSVVDEGKVSVNESDESSILANILLTSDMKGDVEQPNYYFANINDDARSNLDLVMLTHGYRRFEWKPLLNNAYPPLAYQPEKSLEIAGTAKMLGGRALNKGAVSLIAPFSGRGILSAVTDDKGNFRFTDLVYMDSAKFILQAVNAKGSNNTVLTYNADKPVPVTFYQQPQATRVDTGLIAYMKTHQKQHDQLYAQGLITGKMLREVKINAHKLDKPAITRGYGVADYIIHGNDITYGGLLSERLDGRIPGVIFVSTGIIGQSVAYKRITMASPPTPIRIVIDGSEMPAGFDINSISTALVDKIEIATNATVGDLSTEGAFIITLKHGLQANEISSKGILHITARGFYKAREFYSPKYESATDNKLADLRTTIYWNPEIATDKSGNAQFDFYNADGKCSYKVVVEGIDAEGNLGRQVFRYKVE